MESVPEKADLLRRLARALAFAERAIEVLGSAGYSDVNDPDASVRAEKVIGETGLLLLAAAAVKDGEIGAQVNALARRLIPLARSERLRIAICLRPALAHEYALAHFCLNNLGFRDPNFDRLVAASLAAEEANGRELLPYQLLEQEWIGDLANSTPTAPPRHSGTANWTRLAHRMDALVGSRDDIYAFTHALLFTTRLGARQPRLPRSRQSILEDAEAALARSMDADDFDVAAEVLMSWPLLCQSWSTAASFSFRVLSQIEDEVGFLPSPITRADRYQSLQGMERTRYGLASAYHTAYVMGLLCAVMLRASASPPKSVLNRRAYPGAASAILEVMTEPARSPHWNAPFLRLDGKEQDSLAPWLLAIASRRAMARSDFDRLRRLLWIAVQRGIAPGPASRQAAGLLRRVATFQASHPSISDHFAAKEQLDEHDKAEIGNSTTSPCASVSGP